jgi:hypothetical protein|tara:strand:+ start:1571 stop:1786 length:216 start_codon:yes stop_codon:yes gene_type:complete
LQITDEYDYAPKFIGIMNKLLESDKIDVDTKLNKLKEFHTLNLDTINKIPVQDSIKINTAMTDAWRRNKKE